MQRSGCGPGPVDQGAGHAFHRMRQCEVEGDRGKRTIHTLVALSRFVAVVRHVGDQFIPGSKCEVLVDVLVALDVDLGRKLPESWRRDEEVDMRRALAVAAKQIEQLL